MHLCFKMLNTGRRKLNTTTTQLSPFTHFTLICNDVTKPTVHTYKSVQMFWTKWPCTAFEGRRLNRPLAAWEGSATIFTAQLISDTVQLTVLMTVSLA